MLRSVLAHWRICRSWIQGKDTKKCPVNATNQQAIAKWLVKNYLERSKDNLDWDIMEMVKEVDKKLSSKLVTKPKPDSFHFRP